MGAAGGKGGAVLTVSGLTAAIITLSDNIGLKNLDTNDEAALVALASGAIAFVVGAIPEALRACGWSRSAAVFEQAVADEHLSGEEIGQFAAAVMRDFEGDIRGESEIGDEE